MNIFVLNTGRCGSTTFIMACRHITNFTCGHETRVWMLGESRFKYPENHIEADNRLSWLLGRLDKTYGDNAIYIHLKRNENETAHSYAVEKRYSGGIMRAYRRGGILPGLPETSDPMAVALDYCQTVNSNIELFLKDKTKKMEVFLEDIDRDFPLFWKFINAEGEINAALAEFNNRYNVSELPPIIKKKKSIIRILLKIKRLIVKLPDYIKKT